MQTTNTRSSIQMRNEANELMNNINDSLKSDNLTTLLTASLVVEMKNDRIKRQNDLIQKQQALIILLMSNVQAVHDKMPEFWDNTAREEFYITHKHLSENGFGGFSGFAEEMDQILNP